MSKEKKTCGADTLWRFVKYTMGFDKLTRKIARSWTLKQRKLAQNYFIAMWADANDNDVVVPKRPKFLDSIYHNSMWKG